MTVQCINIFVEDLCFTMFDFKNYFLDYPIFSSSPVLSKCVIQLKFEYVYIVR